MRRLAVRESSVLLRSRECRIRTKALYVAGCLAGALGALTPTGIADLRGGLGIVGGMMVGVIASATVSPILMTAIVSMQIASDYRSGLTTAMYLNGLPLSRVHLGGMLASIREWARVTVGAVIGGACVGLGDGVRGSEIWRWERLSFGVILGCLAVIGYVALLASTVAIVSRRPLVTIVVVVASLVLGVLLVPTLADLSSVAVALSTWLPLQPVMAAVPAPVLGRFSTGAELTDALPVAAAWVVACSAVWAWRR